MNILEENIDDQRFTDLLRRLFKAEVINLELGGLNSANNLGIPQENPLSSILGNVYLDKLDDFCSELRQMMFSGKNLKEKFKNINISKISKNFIRK